jgi:hypothetical protein
MRRAKSVSSLTIDPWVSSSDRTGEEEVTHPMGHDRAKTVVWKGKEKVKEGSSSQSEASSAVGGTIFTLKKLNTSFAKA